jgi:hypothetical protein
MFMPQYNVCEAGERYQLGLEETFATPEGNLLLNPPCQNGQTVRGLGFYGQQQFAKELTKDFRKAGHIDDSQEIVTAGATSIIAAEHDKTFETNYFRQERLILCKEAIIRYSNTLRRYDRGVDGEVIGTNIDTYDRFSRNVLEIFGVQDDTYSYFVDLKKIGIGQTDVLQIEKSFTKPAAIQNLDFSLVSDDRSNEETKKRTVPALVVRKVDEEFV